MKRDIHNLDRRSGFTLIELLVALAMVIAVAAVLASSLHIAFQATNSATAVIEPSRTADLTMQFLGGDLQNALQTSNYLVGTFEGTQGTDDRGHEADDLVFFSTADSPQHVDANGEIKQVELKIIESPSGDHLLVRQVIRNIPPLSITNINPDQEVICRGVSSFSLQYYDGSNWNLTWDSTAEDNTVPVAVQVTLELDPPANSKSPPQQFVRIFPLPCSTAGTDPAVNTGVSIN
jgi:type II secretion system protein J